MRGASSEATERATKPFMECMAVGAVGDVDLEVDPIALTVEVLSAVEIVGKDAVDRASASPLVRDQADVGEGLIQTEKVQVQMGLSSIEL